MNKGIFNSGGLKELKEGVLNRGLCTVCGGCVGICPYIRSWRERIVPVDDCGIEEGDCMNFCPRSFTDLEAIHKATFQKTRADYVLGEHAEVLMSRARDMTLRDSVQYGGTVTALVRFALSKNIIKGAVLTGWPMEFNVQGSTFKVQGSKHPTPNPEIPSHNSELNKGHPLLPRPFLATRPEDAVLAGGSKYTAGPTLGLYNRLLKEGHSGLGVVGRPCQVVSLRKKSMINHRPSLVSSRLKAQGSKLKTPNPEVSSRLKAQGSKRKISNSQLPACAASACLSRDGRQVAAGRRTSNSLVIGLFCMWAMDYREFTGYLKPRIELDSVIKLDIPENDFLIHTRDREIRFPFEEIKAMRLPSCDICYDFTAELADISVGSTEFDNEWNTLIIRSERGHNLVAEAVKEGALETREFPGDRLGILRRASLNKKKRALRSIMDSYPYLKVSKDEENYILIAQ